MKKLVMICATLALLGCGDDDTRMVMLMDSGGGGVDAGGGVDTGPSGTDTGPMGMDTGGGPRDCEQMIPGLPGELLPRCDSSTLTCIMGCADADCQTDCLGADTTPAETMSGQMIDCNGCWNFQTIACIDSFCHDDLAAFFCCVEDQGCADPNACPACDGQLSTVQTCSGTIPSGGCNDFLLACFPAG